MAHTYTPGLKVMPRTGLSRARILPLAGNVLVREGEEVAAEKIVARAELPGDVSLVNAVAQLGCSPGELPGLMEVQVGAAIRKGARLARTHPWPIFDFLRAELASPIDGTLENVSAVTGQLILRGPPKPIELPAYVDGQVAKVLPREGVVVRTTATFVQGIFGIGGEAFGPLRIACDSPDQELTPDRLKPEHRGAIVIGGSFVSGATLQRAIELGIAAVVVGGFHDHDLRALLGYDVGVAVTGHEQVGLTLIMTEGFGRIPMRRRTFDLLAARRGARASVNGATQIRAGVQRPEIVIPWPDAQGGAASVEDEPVSLAAGAAVRVIRQPWFGQLGHVVGMPSEPQTIPTEAHARVAEIQLADGRTVVVPRANLEMIEEQQG